LAAQNYQVNVKEHLKLMKKKTAIILIIIGVIAISIGLYTILPLFTNTMVDEPLPTASGLSPSASGIYNFLEKMINHKLFSFISFLG
jgi:uncharacterized membrane protein HdeD (DUF308 family)